MPRYYFDVIRSVISDPQGIELPDESAAREYAKFVAEKIMQDQGEETGNWRLLVSDHERSPLFSTLLYAAAGETHGDDEDTAAEAASC